MYKDTFNKKG